MSIAISKKRAPVLTVAALALLLLVAGCYGRGTTEPDDFPDLDRIAFLDASPPAGSSVPRGSNVRVAVRWEARRTREIQVILVSGGVDLAASAPVRVGPGSGRTTLTVSADATGEVDFIDVLISQADFDRRVLDSERTRWSLLIK